MRVPEITITGTQTCLECIPPTLLYHVMITRICGVSGRSLAAAGTWSPSCSRIVVGTLPVEQPQDDSRPPTRLVSGRRALLGRVVDAATHRTQERWLAQRASPETTFAASLIWASYKKFWTVSLLYLR